MSTRYSSAVELLGPSLGGLIAFAATAAEAMSEVPLPAGEWDFFHLGYVMEGWPGGREDEFLPFAEGVYLDGARRRVAHVLSTGAEVRPGHFAAFDRDGLPIEILQFTAAVV